MWYYPYSSLPIQSTISPITPFPALPTLGASPLPEPAAPTEPPKDTNRTRSRSRSRSPAASPKNKESKHKKPLSPAHARIRKTDNNSPANAMPSSGKYFDIETKPPDLMAKADYFRTLNQLHQAMQEVEKLQNANRDLLQQKNTLEERLIDVQTQVSQAQVAPVSHVVATNTTAPPLSVLDNYPAYPITQAPQPDEEQIVMVPTLRPYIGVEIIEVPALGGGTDVVVKNVMHGGAAADAGIQPNDKLIKWNGIPIRSRADFGLAISEARVGDIVKLQIERGPRKRNEVVRIEVMGVDPSNEPQSPVVTRTPLYSRPSSSRTKTQESRAGDYPEYVADAMEELQRLNMTLN